MIEIYLIYKIVFFTAFIFINQIQPFDLWNLFSTPSVWPWIFFTVVLLGKMLIDYLNRNRRVKIMNDTILNLTKSIQALSKQFDETTHHQNKLIMKSLSDISTNLGEMTESHCEKSSQKFESIENKITVMDNRLKDLYAWHSVTDSDGVRIWYIRKSLTEYIQKLNENMTKLTDAILKQGSYIEALDEKIEKMSQERKDDKKELKEYIRDVGH